MKESIYILLYEDKCVSNCSVDFSSSWLPILKDEIEKYIDYKRKKLYDKKNKSKKGDKIKKILENKILNDLVTKSAVQSKNTKTKHTVKPALSKKRKLKKSDDNDSSTSSDTSDSSSNEDIPELEQKLLKKYHDELKDLSLQSKKLNNELHKEKMKQTILRKKLKETLKKQQKQQKQKNDSNDSDSCNNSSPEESKSKYDQKKKLKHLEKLKEMLEKKSPKPESLKMLPLKEKMMEKLKAARFRFLNEQIYTTPSKEAQKIFEKDPDAFRAYHEGYKQQIKTWPLNPLDVVIKTIKKMPQYVVIADFGCGEAKLAKSVKQKVYSFDLVAIDDTVTACDMAHVPLQDSSVDIVVFCLSLMSTNLGDYLLEANRVLKIGGTVKIVEVVSRFENPDDFIKAIQLFGFKLLWKDLTQNYFYFMDFKKVQNIKDKKKLPTFKLHLQPCLYKKR